MNIEKRQYILEVLKRSIEIYINYNSYDEVETIEPINVGDMFISHSCDEDGPYTDYFKIVEDKDKLFLIECDKNGNIQQVDDFEEYETLNDYTEGYMMLQLVRDLDLIPMN